MALTLGDNFSYQGAKPLDARLKYDTLAAMKAVGDSTMYEGCLAYCVATDKTYQWKSTNTVDTDLGKWREFADLDIMPSEDMEEVMKPLPSFSGGSANPTGTIISFMGVYAPQGYLKCDGTVYNIADYQRLADFFKAQFGSANKFGGDGTTTFAVPNLLGEFLRMTGTNSHANQGSGAAVGVHQDGTDIPFVGVYNETEGGTTGTGTNATRIDIRFRKSAQTSTVINKYDSTVKGSANAKYMTAKSSMNYDPTSDSNTWTNVTSRPTNTSVLYCIKD